MSRQSAARQLTGRHGYQRFSKAGKKNLPPASLEMQKQVLLGHAANRQGDTRMMHRSSACRRTPLSPVGKT
jgi:hypothetical protein